MLLNTAIILAEAPTISDIISAGTSVMTWAATNVVTVMSTALQSPVVLTFTGCALVGFVFRLGKKIMHV